MTSYPRMLFARLGVPFALVAALHAAPAPAQTPPPAVLQTEPVPGRGGAQGRGAGPNFPQQQRRLAEAAVLEKGKGLYESLCSACHGIDLRGGQQGGPNLLRSQTVLLDKQGKLIAPIVQGGRPNPPAGAPPMPAFPLPADDIKTVAEYLHSVARAGRQGRPPEGALVLPEKVLVGNAAAGQAYFAAPCSSCHSVTGDLQGLAGRAADPRQLQDLWISGGGGRGGRGRGGSGRPATVTVTTASGERIEGRLARIDDFTVSVVQPDGTRRTFARRGADPRIDINDPADAHRTLVRTLADTDMHDVTAYLWRSNDAKPDHYARRVDTAAVGDMLAAFALAGPQ